MGRSARRAQQRAERRQQQQPVRASRRPQVSVTAAHAEGARRGGAFFKPRWATDIVSELRKVTWPTRRDTTHLTVVVIVVAALVGALLGGADIGFSWLIEHTVLR